MSIPGRDIAKSLVDAAARGELSKDALKALQSVDGITAEIGVAMGNQLIDVGDVLLLSILVDDSGSISAAGNTNAVMKGHNRIIQIVMEAGVMQNVLLQTKYLNGRVINDYRPLVNAVPLDGETYREREFGGTPLFRQTIVLLGAVAAKTQELRDRGKTARSITLIITDGDDQHSGNITAQHVKWVVNDLRNTKQHIIAGMGVEDGGTNFRQIFREMGIPDQWHLPPSASEDKILEVLQDFGQVAAQASLNPAAFERLALGSGFSS